MRLVLAICALSCALVFAGSAFADSSATDPTAVQEAQNSHFANLLGLVPYGSTATGNIAVTATLALITFVVVEVAGMKAQGPAYIKTIFYWPSDQPLAVKLPMTLIMTPVEIAGKITKPFALAIRLFANITAGHVVLLALISLIFTFGSYYVAAAPIAMGVAISMLEIFVAFLQAFIFTLLASVFIGLIREGAH